ncbi:Spx/MgsR family RNA polymerase-binding regulatory protein [Saccharibacter sp. 17.LH.SD]|uniref:arsenate reductase n=1 Tax=Saccharibacter sp. 17.LH.SD TaxID=2689393 RepID=UPI0013711123|nr:arsenate reductase [Saccharibacter sp. 17.LH.SD]MXV43813.1 Spx/MgsR family RNA polymerase-binding regulatory protein [Saccharibacter sp. 17.LH.SD]
MICGVTIYGIRNCSTVKKAISWLDSQGIAYHFHDVRKDGLAQELLMTWVRALGWERLLNRSGMTFRKLPEEDKNGLDEAKAVSLMLAHPASIRRPITVYGACIQVGFKPEAYEAAFLLHSEDN